MKNTNANTNSSQHSKTMQFRVVIPVNVKPGQLLRIRCPDGTEGDVRVPKGLKSGNSFIFEMPAEALINKGVVMSQSTTEKKRGGGSSSGNKVDSSGAGSAGDSNSSGVTSSSNLFFTSFGFLDKEIVGKQDFITALAVGVIIGLSIVAGFFMGVLLVTEP